MIKGIDRVPIVSLYSLFQYSKHFDFALSFLSRKLYYIQFFPSYSHITCSFLAIKITALQPSTPPLPSVSYKPRETIIFILFYLRHRFVSFPIRPTHFSFNFRTSELRFFVSMEVANFLDLNNGRPLCRHCCFHRIFISSLPFNFLKLGRKEFFHANRFITRFIQF